MQRLNALWTELREAINRLANLRRENDELRRQVYALQQQLRDLRGR